MASSASAFDEVDDAALDGLLGSDTEEVGARLNRSQPRLKERKASAPHSGSFNPSGRKLSEVGEWDDDSGDEKGKGETSEGDEDQPAGSRRPPPRAIPPRHHRPLPTKRGRPTSASSSLADSMDAALFGLSPSTAASTGPLSASVAKKDFSLTAPPSLESVSHVRSKSRTLLDVDRDSLLPSSHRAPSSRPLGDPDTRTAGRTRADLRQALDAPTPEGTPQQGEGRRLSIDREIGSRLASSVGRDGDGPSIAGRGAEEDVADRRAKYREMMRKKREERLTGGSVDVPVPEREPAKAASSSPPARPVPAASTDDAWAALDDPMASISDGSSAADKIAQSLAALAAPTLAVELPMPAQVVAATEPVGTTGLDLGGPRARRPMVGRRAALTLGLEEAARPTTAPPSLPPTTAHAMEVRPATALPAPTAVAAVTEASPNPSTSLQQWLQWLGVNESTEPALMPLARKATAMVVPSHFTHQGGVWTDLRTGRRLTSHPALARFKRKVEQKRLALRYNVVDDDSDEDDDTFWKESDLDPPAAAVAEQPLPAPSLPPVSSPVSATSVSPPLPLSAVEFAPLPVPAVLSESLAQQRAALTAHYTASINQLQSALSSQSSHLQSMTALHSRQLEDALAHAHRMAQAERSRDAALWEQRLKGMEATHRREVEGLREALYDSKVMKGLTESISGNVRSIETLAEQVGAEQKVREAEREQAWAVREELIAQRELSVERERSRIEDQTTAQQAQAALLTQREEGWRKEKTTLQAELASQQQRLQLLTSQLHAERELLMAEKKKFIADAERWERAKLQREDELQAMREVVEREKRTVEREVEEGRSGRAEMMQRLDAEREELTLQHELLALRRRKVEVDEGKVVEAQADLHLRKEELVQREEQLERLGRVVHEQSERLVKERRGMDEEQRLWAEQRTGVLEGPLGGGRGMHPGVTWTPTVWFAPFMVGTQHTAAGHLTPADVKLLEVSSPL